MHEKIAAIDMYKIKVVVFWVHLDLWGCSMFGNSGDAQLDLKVLSLHTMCIYFQFKELCNCALEQPLLVLIKLWFQKKKFQCSKNI